MKLRVFTAARGRETWSQRLENREHRKKTEAEEGGREQMKLWDKREGEGGSGGGSKEGGRRRRGGERERWREKERETACAPLSS